MKNKPLMLGLIVTLMAYSVWTSYTLIKTNNKKLGSPEFYWLMDRAACSGDGLGIKMLLDYGADPDGVKDYEKFSKKYNFGYEPSWPINQSFYTGNKDIVTILLNAGAKVDMPEGEGFTALIIATEHGYPEIVEVLLKAGADRNYVGANGTALDIAKKNNFYEIIALLENKSK